MPFHRQKMSSTQSRTTSHVAFTTIHNKNEAKSKVRIAFTRRMMELLCRFPTPILHQGLCNRLCKHFQDGTSNIFFLPSALKHVYDPPGLVQVTCYGPVQSQDCTWMHFFSRTFCMHCYISTGIYI